MNTVTIDYLNMQFMVYQDGQLQHNLLPVEVQRVVIEQIIRENTQKIYRELDEKLSPENVLRQLAAY